MMIRTLLCGCCEVRNNNHVGLTQRDDDGRVRTCMAMSLHQIRSGAATSVIHLRNSCLMSTLQPSRQSNQPQINKNVLKQIVSYIRMSMTPAKSDPCRKMLVRNMSFDGNKNMWAFTHAFRSKDCVVGKLMVEYCTLEDCFLIGVDAGSSWFSCQCQTCTSRKPRRWRWGDLGIKRFCPARFETHVYIPCYVPGSGSMEGMLIVSSHYKSWVIWTSNLEAPPDLDFWDI